MASFQMTSTLNLVTKFAAAIGNLFVTDNLNGIITEYNPAGEFLRQ
jgi:hypothetical protein